MNEKLRILIEAGINEALSVDRINKDLETLQSKVANLKIGIEIDKSALDSVSNLSKELNEATTLLKEQSGAIDNAKRATDNATDSTKRETEALKANTNAAKENHDIKTKITTGETFVRTDTTTGSKYDSTTTGNTQFTDGTFASHPSVQNINHAGLEEAQKKLEAFSNSANQRLSELRKHFGNFNQDVSKLKGELGALNAETSTPTDFSNVENKIKSMESLQKQQLTAQRDSEKLANQMADGRIREHEKFEKMEAQAQQKRIEAAHRLANTENKRIEDRKKLEQSTDARWQKNLHDREQKELASAKTVAEARKKLEQDTDSWWNKALHDKDLKDKQAHIKQSEALDRAHFMALKTNNEKIEAMEKLHVIALEQNRKRDMDSQKQQLTLEQQNLALRRTIQLQIDRMVQDPQYRRGKAQLLEYRNELHRLGLTATTTSTQMKNIQYSVKSLGVEMQAAGIKTNTFMGAFQNAMIKFPIWMGASTAFFGVIRGIRSALDNIIEIDSQMVTLARVSGGEIDRNHILIESNNLAQKLGNNLKNVNEGLIDFARQGFRGEGLIAMTEAATLFSNISEMEVDEASSGLTAIMKGFNMLPEEIMVAVDAINEVDKLLSPMLVMA